MLPHDTSGEILGLEPPAPTTSMPSRPASTWTVVDVSNHPHENPEALRQPNLLNRLRKFVFDLRTFRRREPNVLPVHQPQLQPWAPLHIEKRPLQCCEHCVKRRKRKWRDRIVLIVLIVLLLYLLGNTVALDVITSMTGGSSASTSGSSANTSALSANEQLCLAEFAVNAPANASLYPCSTCFSILPGVSSSYLDAHSQDASQIQDAVQFCALRGFFVEANDEGQSSLQNGGWMQNVDFCGWTGVTCNGSGRVSSLVLSTPGVPTIIPDQIGGLTALQTLQVIGDNSLPAGALPSSFANLTALSTLEFQSTSITGLSDDLFDSLKGVTSLTLESNNGMSSVLPSSLANLPVQNLVITDQPLTNPLPTLFSSSSIQSSLKLLDLSTTNLTGSIPSSVSSLSALVELHLDHNDLTGPLPSTFPSTLQILNLSNNTGLSGPVEGSFCELGALQECDVTGTGLKAAGSCGVCQFSS